MEDQQIEGLPEGVTLRPVQPAPATSDSSQVEGLPEGVTLRPVTPPVQKTVAPKAARVAPATPNAAPVDKATVDPAMQQDAVENFLDKDVKGTDVPSLKPVYQGVRGLYHGAVGDEETARAKGQTTTASPEAANLGFTPENVGYNVGKMGHGVYEFGKEAVKDVAGNEPIVIPDKNDIHSFADPKAHTLVAKYVTAPSMAERQASQDEMQQYFETKGPAAAGHAISSFLHGTLGEYVPFIGPLAMALEAQAQKGDIGGALSQLASLYAVEKGTGTVKDGIADRVKAKVADLTKTPEVKQAETNVQNLGKERDAAQAKLDAAKSKHQLYTASHQQGIGSPEKIVNEVNKAQEAYDEAEAHHELAKEDLANKQKTLTQRAGAAVGKVAARALPTPAPAPEVPAEEVQAASAPAPVPAPPVLGRLGEPKAPPTVSPAHATTTIPQEPTAAPKVGYRTLQLPGGEPVGKQALLTEGSPMPKIKLPEAKPTPAPTDEGALRDLKATKGEVVESPEKKVGRLLQEALKGNTEPAKAVAEAPEASTEKRKGAERRQEEIPVTEERRTGSRRNAAGIRVDEQGNPEMSPDLQGHWQAGVFGEKPIEDVGTKARQTNPEPTRAETNKPKEVFYRGTNADEAAKIEESGKITPDAFSSGHITPDKATAEAYAKANGGKVYSVNSEDVPEKDLSHYRETGRGPITLSSEVPTVEHAGRPNIPKEEQGYAAKKEEVLPQGADVKRPTKSAEEYHPAVEQKVNELSDDNLRKLAKAHGLNPDEYDFNARDERRHRTERDQLAKDITAQIGEDEKINLGRAAESTEKQGIFQGADVSAKGRAARAEKMFPRLRGPVDENGNPKVSGGAPDTVGTAEAAKSDTEHFANAKKELGPDASISEVAKRAQEMKDTHAQVAEHDNNGGSTFSSKGKDLNGTDKYSVGAYPDRAEQVDKLTPERLDEFKKKNADVLSKEDHAIGTWKDPDTGKAVLDVTKLYDGKDEAIAAGKAANQKAIYHLGGEGEIQTGGTGRVNEKGSPVDEFGNPTVSGGAPEKKLPTGDALIKKYGESNGDPKDLTFILKDGRGVANTGIEHDHMLGGKTNEKVPPRERFIAEGNIRVRPRQGAGGREVAMSIPESGVTTDQLKYIQKMSPQLKSGAVMIEVGKPGGGYKAIPYGEASPEQLETAIRGLGPVLNDKGSPIDWNGNPTVSGGSQSAGTGKAKDALGFIKDNSNVLPAGKVGVDDLGDASKRHFLLSDGSMISEKVPIHSDIEGMVGGKNLQAAKAIRMAGPAEFDVYSEPTPQQVRELGRILKDYREEHQYGKIYWSITNSLGKEVGNAGTFGDFQRDIEAAYPDKNQTAIKDLQKSLPDLAQRHLTQEEKDSITTTATGKPRTAGTAKFIENMEKIPTVQEYVDIALQGEGAKDWYSRSTRAFDAVHEAAPDYFKEGDKEKFMGVLAGSSPQQSVAMNLRETLGFWKEWVDAGRPEFSLDKWQKFGDIADEAWKEDGSPRAGGTMKGASKHWDYAPTGKKWAAENLLLKNLTLPDTKVPNIIKALNGEPMWPDLQKNAAFKAPSFAENLRKWVNGESTGTKHVTNDSWMGLFGGIDKSALSKPENYHPLSVATRAAAQELDWEPEEAQAAIWSFTQALTEKGVEDPELVRHYSEDFKDLLANDVEVRDLLKGLGVNIDQLDSKLEAIGEKPQVSGRSSATTAHSVGQLKSRIEEARGKGAIPEPKSVQGNLFRENPAYEHKANPGAGHTIVPEDEAVRFNPEEFGNEKPRLEKLGEKKSPYGKIK